MKWSASPLYLAGYGRATPHLDGATGNPRRADLWPWRSPPRSSPISSGETLARTWLEGRGSILTPAPPILPFSTNVLGTGGTHVVKLYPGATSFLSCPPNCPFPTPRHTRPCAATSEDAKSLFRTRDRFRHRFRNSNLSHRLALENIHNRYFL